MRILRKRPKFVVSGFDLCGLHCIYCNYVHTRVIFYNIWLHTSIFHCMYSCHAICFCVTMYKMWIAGCVMIMNLRITDIQAYFMTLKCSDKLMW